MKRLRRLGLVAGLLLSGTGAPAALAQATISISEAVEQIGGYHGKVTTLNPDEDYGSVLVLLKQTRAATEDPEAIKGFRAIDDLGVIRTLLDMAAIDDRGIRINASLILANVVDNTTVCAVIDRLVTGNINDITRYNLLQVVKIVAGYARPDVRQWIEEALASTQSQVEGAENATKTRALVDEIAGVLDTSTPIGPKPLATKFPSDYGACAYLPGIESLESEAGGLAAPADTTGQPPE
jgi:hypothetical protein